MRSFLFRLGAPAAGEVAITAIALYESPDGLAGWAVVDTIDAIALVDDPGGKKRWDCASADPERYAKLVAVSASGAERHDGVVLPPRPADPDTLTVFCWTIDAGLGVKAGVPFSARPKTGHAVAGSKLIVDRVSVVTDAAGYAALTLPANAGVLRLALGPVSAEIDTAGRAGQGLNLMDLL